MQVSIPFPDLFFDWELRVVQEFQITRAAELESLAVFRDFIDSTLESFPEIGDEESYDLKLAVDEACTNVIIHGYAGMNPGSIILRLQVLPRAVRMVITDFGHAFEPDEAPRPDVEAGLEDQEMGGFGLFIIYQTMDEVAYETTGSCNRLILTRRLGTNRAGKA
jgi:serine/threonine-protein kinase RsbW